MLVFYLKKKTLPHKNTDAVMSDPSCSHWQGRAVTPVEAKFIIFTIKASKNRGFPSFEIQKVTGWKAFPGASPGKFLPL